ncbi:MAG: hypothetical protein HUJ96_09880 [Marinilabiliaceae bacterium]|nr:hypothetical protein [Marinilabiliaceae bacterium]
MIFRFDFFAILLLFVMFGMRAEAQETDDNWLDNLESYGLQMWISGSSYSFTLLDEDDPNYKPTAEIPDCSQDATPASTIKGATSISFGPGITRIGNYAFKGLENIQAIIFDDPFTKVELGTSCLYHVSNSKIQLKAHNALLSDYLIEVYLAMSTSYIPEMVSLCKEHVDSDGFCMGCYAMAGEDDDDLKLKANSTNPEENKVFIDYTASEPDEDGFVTCDVDLKNNNQSSPTGAYFVGFFYTSSDAVAGTVTIKDIVWTSSQDGIVQIENSEELFPSSCDYIKLPNDQKVWSCDGPMLIAKGVDASGQRHTTASQVSSAMIDLTKYSALKLSFKIKIEECDSKDMRFFMESAITSSESGGGATGGGIGEQKQNIREISVTTGAGLLKASNQLKSPSTAIYKIDSDVMINLKNNVSLKGTIDRLGASFDYDDVDMKTLNVWNNLQVGPNAFGGTLKGNNNVVSNMSCKMTVLFGDISANGKVENVEFNGRFFIDSPVLTSDADDEDKKIVLLSKNLNGKVRNAVIKGDVIIPREYAKRGICLVDNTTSSEPVLDHVVVDIDLYNLGEDASKATYIVKQTVGVNRSQGKAKKVATVKAKASNKAISTILYKYTDEELNKEMREFDENEMQSGAAAFWLNFDDEGYTGAFNQEWTCDDNGTRLRQEGEGAVVQLRYVDIEGNELEEVDYSFAKIGESIKVYKGIVAKATTTYYGNEQTVTITDNGFVVPQTSTGFIYVTLSSVVNIPLSLDEKMEVKPTCTVRGGLIECSEAFRIYTLSGQDVTALNGALTRGLYIVKSEHLQKKVIVRR